jgi:hypothetical protein
VVEAYADASGWVMANPVGTGPFQLAEWRRGQKIVLEANPGFREEHFPTAGEPADAPTIARMKGKRLAQVGRVEILIIEESNPQLLAFNSGELDYVNVPPDLIPNALDGGNRLKPTYAEQGVRHWRITQPASSSTRTTRGTSACGASRTRSCGRGSRATRSTRSTSTRGSSTTWTSSAAARRRSDRTSPGRCCAAAPYRGASHECHTSTLWQGATAILRCGVAGASPRIGVTSHSIPDPIP